MLVHYITEECESGDSNPFRVGHNHQCYQYTRLTVRVLGIEPRSCGPRPHVIPLHYTHALRRHSRDRTESSRFVGPLPSHLAQRLSLPPVRSRYTKPLSQGEPAPGSRTPALTVRGDDGDRTRFTRLTT